jgi:membrane protein DedA with SNARE-associated domain
MEWWRVVRVGTAVFLARHGLLAGCLALLIEEAGIPLPMLPGDLVMLVLGIQARQGRVPLWQVLVALEAVTVVGATLLYVVAHRAGRGLVLRYGRFLHLTPARLAQAEAWVVRRGWVAIVLARLLPGLRVMTAIGAGVLAVPPQTFLPAMAAGALLYILCYTLLGYTIGPPVLRLAAEVHVPLELAGDVLLLVGAVVWIGRARRGLHPRLLAAAHTATHVHLGRRLRAGLAAGAVATLVSTLLMNVLVYVASDIALVTPGQLVATTAARLALTFARQDGVRWLVLAVPLFLGVGLAWGALYGAWAEPRLRGADWVRGVLFALVPLAVALLVVFPLLRLWVVSADFGALAAVGEGVRHLVYGAVLGITLPVFLIRQPRASPARAAVPTPPPSPAPWARQPTRSGTIVPTP